MTLLFVLKSVSELLLKTNIRREYKLLCRYTCCKNRKILWSYGCVTESNFVPLLLCKTLVKDFEEKDYCHSANVSLITQRFFGFVERYFFVLTSIVVRL